jgi:hypothetical protein
MISKKIVLVVLACVAFLSGCNEPGMNVKMGSADAGAGVAVIGALEAVPVEHFEATKTNIIKISTDLLGFVKTGHLGKLPLDMVQHELESFIIKKGYGEYAYVVEAALQYVQAQSVDVDIIGENNVKLIQIALEETIRNAERCTIGGRTQWKEDERRMRELRQSRSRYLKAPKSEVSKKD